MRASRLVDTLVLELWSLEYEQDQLWHFWDQVHGCFSGQNQSHGWIRRCRRRSLIPKGYDNEGRHEMDERYFGADAWVWSITGTPLLTASFR